ncbi:MAG: hypothetical protein COV43_09035 [Deltaproteobacteria bacterium CG11_big_fil_rev_8_21_14_0_20_42_23]|nr:MAG: hypothetical protein COV43_09035 [Deltaproteobacteria bacterium CG11_big_fil_rev_8_21_14_0_20_42_23]PJC63421.1 MAG: ferritin-like domain-containing protein [Deltaproteobacteria bacterium CG_4_9_14_0_2_um_filter_42_21]
MESLQEVFIHELKDMLHAEKQLVKALPKMAKAADNEQLRKAFQSHLSETKNHVTRLEKVFKLFDKSAKGKNCKGMHGIVSEGEELISDEDKGVARDTSLICGAQKAEHYEIATYGNLCTWAKQLGNHEALKLLKENMHEEKLADEKLTQIAKDMISELSHNDGGYLSS